MRLAAALALVLLAGCSPAPLHMKVREVDGRLEVEVFTRGWLGLRSGDPPCVRTIELRRGRLPRPGAVLWRAQLPSGRQCADLARFVVGRAPPGFSDRVALGPGRLAGDYVLVAEGIGYGEEAISLPRGDSQVPDRPPIR